MGFKPEAPQGVPKMQVLYLGQTEEERGRWDMRQQPWRFSKLGKKAHIYTGSGDKPGTLKSLCGHSIKPVYLADETVIPEEKKCCARCLKRSKA